MKSIGKYDQYDWLYRCIGGAMDENVQSDENVPSLERKRPRFRTTSTKMSYIPIKNLVTCKDENVPDSNQQGTKTSQIPIIKDKNVPDSNQQGRKRPRFRYNMFGFNAIKCDFWENVRISAVKTKICGIMRRMENYAELCGEQEIVRYRTHRT